MAIVRPVTGRGAGPAGWPLPTMVPVWSVFQPRFVLPVKGSVMTTSILVTGGTGPLGRPVAQRLGDAGASETVLSRCGDRGNRQPQQRMIADWQCVRERW